MNSFVARGIAMTFVFWSSHQEEKPVLMSHLAPFFASRLLLNNFLNSLMVFKGDTSQFVQI